MRTEAEMLDLIVETAIDDDRIRAVIMNGSRVNPNIRRYSQGHLSLESDPTIRRTDDPSAAGGHAGPAAGY